MIELYLVFDNTVSQTNYMISHVHKNRQGQATLLIVTVVCVVGIILLMTSLDSFVRDYNYKAKDFNQVLLDETTSSTFAIMETALERRLWEPPPDENCLRSENISVTGTFPDNVKWTVTAFFNAKTRNYEMKAEGENVPKKLKSIFRKKVKVMDLSDYLVLSMNSTPVRLSRLTSAKAPTAMIARDRRIYTKGPLILGAALERPSEHQLNFNGSTANFPSEWGTILQGDRMQFSGGIYYAEGGVATPNHDSRNGNAEALLTPFGVPYLTTPTHLGQAGAGYAIFTKDYEKAMKLKGQVISGNTTPVTKADLKNEVYPISLSTSGTAPVKAWTSVDNGTYLNDPNKFAPFYYYTGGAAEARYHVDVTCLSRADAFDTKKYCSHSEHFPRGFAQWRRDAGLEGTIFTADAIAVPAPTLSWENMQALEDDAKQCGTVISAPVNPYVDCPVWDKNFLNDYKNGTVTGCQNVSQIDLDTLPLANFNPAALNDPANEGRMLRRVIYLKGPAQIIQKNKQGLMAGLLTSNAARKNLAVWIVSEDMVALKGIQPDETSPLDERPAVVREVVFNDDVSGAVDPLKKYPLSLVLLSPETVHLLSPYYVPMSVDHLKKIWPTSGGMIHPIRHNLTDWERQEDDGFKYGIRSYRIEGVSLISNAAAEADQPFYLRGLWAGHDSSPYQFTANQCMSSLDGYTLKEVPNGKLPPELPVETYKETAKRPDDILADPNSPLPNKDSRFWNHLDHFPLYYSPEVFNVQWSAMGGEARLQSEVVLSGISMATNFANTAPSGKRVLDVPKYAIVDSSHPGLPFDLSHKNFGWTEDMYYKHKPINTPCIFNNFEYVVPIGGLTHDGMSAQPSVNNGAQTFIQASPSADYRNIGSVLGVDQLLIETKEGAE
jgi:hypothetical protein